MIDLEGYFSGDIDIEEMNFTMDSDKFSCRGGSFACAFNWTGLRLTLGRVYCGGVIKFTVFFTLLRDGTYAARVSKYNCHRVIRDGGPPISHTPASFAAAESILTLPLGEDAILYVSPGLYPITSQYSGKNCVPYGELKHSYCGLSLLILKKSKQLPTGRTMTPGFAPSRGEAAHATSSLA
jgi:hypothetical protein